ncbi:hypothetical protein [Geodermatophilus sp. SYSU D00698]
MTDQQTAALPTWPCRDCGEDRVFEQPPCADGHTDDAGGCPEWICTGCGGALLVGGAGVVGAAAVRRAA